jgi:DNA-damage-inducible protein J
MCKALAKHIFFCYHEYSTDERSFSMATETTNVTVRMDKNLKAQAEYLFSELGMNLTTALNVFMRQSVRQGKIPFDISLDIPNAVTIAAMEEADRISKDPTTKRYSSFSEIVKEVRADV